MSSIKDLFKNKNIKFLSNATADSIGDEVESKDYTIAYFRKKERYIPPIDFREPAQFARFGSAEKYYADSIEHIYKTYPYDGSLKERVQWENSSSYLDLYLFDHEYPRTNGHVVFSPDSWGALDQTVTYYGLSATEEYILVKGGPNTSDRSKGHDIQNDTGDYKSGYANIYDVAKNRESNLKIGGTDGNTVEFWLKKPAFITSLTKREVLFDVHTTSSISSSADYGRLTVEMTGAADGSSPFLITFMSGTTGFATASIGQSITTASVADDTWHHYAFTFKNDEDSVEAKLFIDGNCNHTIHSGTTVNYVSGNLVATVGALSCSPSGALPGTTPSVMRGYGKLSGSLDEFRFWKTARTSKDIGRYYIEAVGGGTNTDDANTSLGIYYKFNEGITGRTSTDEIVLDYSGRISNGLFTGYSTGSRETTSAIVESGKATFEFKDPILYYFHPDVDSFYNNKKSEGEYYDQSNNSAIFHTLPAWITEESDQNPTSSLMLPLRNMTQLVGSYFDTLATNISALPTLKHATYLSSSVKSFPFANRLLESVGFSYVPELFSDASILAQYRNRDERTLFKQKLYDTKNRIYQNIYNNITYIYKSKGTEKSLRNLIRCFGVDSELYQINMYSNNGIYELKDNFRSVSENKNYIDFTFTGSNAATVYQYSSSANSDSTSFITASNAYDGTYEGAGLGFTMEAEVMFPRRFSQGEIRTVLSGGTANEVILNDYSPFVTASLFGCHRVVGTENELTWDDDDFSNFQVYAIKDGQYSKRCYFQLTGTAGGFVPNLTSSYYNDVYEENKWNFSVALKPSNYPEGNDLPDSEEPTYKIEFYGIEKVLDHTYNEFLVTGTLTNTEGRKLIASTKSIYVGAHRENFTGSLLTPSDANISSTRVWMDYLPTGTIKQHAMDVKNYGVENPYKSSFLFQDSMSGVYVPQSETLALNWEFATVTGSDASGQFIAQDFSSGSADVIARYNWFGDVVGKQYLAKGDFFPANFSDSVNEINVYSAKKQLPEVINSGDMVKVVPQNDVTYTRESRPIDNIMLIEKSMYQAISQEIINIFSSIKDFNNLIGEPVNMYRPNYKRMEKLRQLFFERVNNTPDLDKYVEYYKWLDNTLNIMLGYLIPASSNINADDTIIQTTVESHVLERNKYTHKYPTLEDKTPDIEGKIFGINELLYDWEFGHAPINDDQADNCLWWKQRAERDDALTSEVSAVDTDKQEILKVATTVASASAPTVAESSSAGIDVYNGSTYALRKLVRPYSLKINEAKELYGGINFNKNRKVGYIREFAKKLDPTDPPESGITVEVYKRPTCDDNSALNDKPNQPFALFNNVETDTGEITPALEDEESYPTVGMLTAPFNLVSSSADISNMNSSYLTYVGQNFTMVNLHHDVYGPDHERPAQGPFTNKFVGGNPERHVFSQFSARNDDPDRQDVRPEAWMFDKDVLGGFDEDVPAFVAPNRNPSMALDWSRPRALYYRDETAKRPVNIRNIQMTTGAASDANPVAGRINQAYAVTNIGNYTNDYDILHTSGRTINNRYLIEVGALSGSAVNSAVVDGLVDYAVPTREVSGSNKFIFVNRFSAPGSPAVSSLGTLDFEAAEYSVYNAIPYRNLTVRMALNELHTDHCKQFGYFSDTQNSAAYALAGETYPGTSGSVNTDSYYKIAGYVDATASFHKVNRNTRKAIKYSNEYTGDPGTTATASIHDNWFVQHQIPQTDLQYAWITGSIIEDYAGPALYGFEKPDFANASLASTDLTFCSASDLGSFFTSGETYLAYSKAAAAAYTDFLPIDFVGINTNIYEPIDSPNNTLGYSSLETVEPGPITNYSNPFYVERNVTLGVVGTLNMVLLHRQGPYGWPSWKQIRGHQHPVTRVHRGENRISWMTRNLEYKDNTTLLRKGIDSQIEPPITSKYMPMRHNLIIKTSDAPNAPITEATVGHSYANQKVQFTDKIDGFVDLNDNTSFNFKNKFPYKTYMYDTLRYMTVGGQISTETNPINEWKSIDISTIIYPREKYTYLKTHRQRDNYENNFWRESRTSKVVATPGYFGLGVTPGRNQTDVNNSQGIATASLGLSQSMWPLDGRTGFTAPPYNSNVTSTPQLLGSGSEGELKNSYSLFHTNADGDGSSTIVQPGALYARRIAEVDNTTTGKQIVGKGDTKWTASEISGLTPFYQDYDSYIEEVKRYGKDYTIIPEFRISEHMDYYINTKKGNFLANNPGFLTMTGTANMSSSNDAGFFKVYSHTDFLKYFTIVQNDFQVPDAGAPKAKELTLRCDALVKLLPYDGFYPAERTVELVSLFSQSYGDETTLRGDDANFRTTLTPLFAPGILYNTVKSGLAVDYPLFISSSGGTEIAGFEYTGSFAVYNGTAAPDRGLSRIKGTTAAARNSLVDNRVPFEALVDPEAYLANKFLVDMEPHASASIQSTSSIGTSNSPTYKMAMHNFLAETVNFFLQDGTLTSISSKPETKFKTVELNSPGLFKEYRMRIVCSHAKYRTRAGLGMAAADFKDNNSLYTSIAPYSISGYESSTNDTIFAINTPTIVMYERTGTFETVTAGASSDLDLQYWGRYSQPRYGSSFGPAIDCLKIADQGVGANTPTYLASWEPFTPPYYDGYSEIEIAYKPSPGSEQPTIQEILADSIITYDRETSVPHIAPTSVLGTWWADSTTSTGIDRANSTFTAHTGAMQLSSSLNWEIQASVQIPVYDDAGKVVSVTDGPSRWVIQPKYECPVLDFSNAGGEPDTYYVDVKGATERQVRGYDRGMWQQYGELVPATPQGSGAKKGIVIQIQDLVPTEMDDPKLTGSLRDLCGFPSEAQTIGKVAEEKIIKEAVVAIPFQRLFDKQNRYPIDRLTIDAAELLINGQTIPEVIPKELHPTTSIVDMVRRMKEFVIPPHLDFLTYKHLTPIAMYIFPFEVKLTQQDLANIWQNLPPTIATSFQARTCQNDSSCASISHDIFTANEDDGTAMLDVLRTTTQWMVFKVKQKAKTNYYSLTADSADDERYRFKIKGVQGDITPNYSYNWPYDFCSLIELVKIRSDIKAFPGGELSVGNALPIMGSVELDDAGEVPDPDSVPPSEDPSKPTSDAEDAFGQPIPGFNDTGGTI